MGRPGGGERERRKRRPQSHPSPPAAATDTPTLADRPIARLGGLWIDRGSNAQGHTRDRGVVTGAPCSSEGEEEGRAIDDWRLAVFFGRLGKEKRERSAWLGAVAPSHHR